VADTLNALILLELTISKEWQLSSAHTRSFLDLIADVYLTELFEEAEKSQFQFIAAALWESRIRQIH